MKRVLITALLVCALAALLCVCAYAEDEPSGIYDVTPLPASEAMNVELTPLDADGNKVASSDCPAALESTSAFYANAEQISVTVSGTDISAAYYLILAQDAVETQEDTIRYIDQGVQSGNSVSFTVYPDKLENGNTYHIYLAGNGGAKVEIGSFKYYVPTPAYTPGDVDASNTIGMNDAVLIMRYLVDLEKDFDETQLKAADVDNSNTIGMNDAVLIMRYLVGLEDAL